MSVIYYLCINIELSSGIKAFCFRIQRLLIATLMNDVHALIGSHFGSLTRSIRDNWQLIERRSVIIIFICRYMQRNESKTGKVATFQFGGRWK